MKKKVFRERYNNNELTTNDILENTAQYIEEKLEEIVPVKKGRKKSVKSDK